MPNVDHALVPGMYVSVAFRLPPRGLVEVPAAALIFRASGTQVARVDAHNKVEFQNVDDRPGQRQCRGIVLRRESGRSAGAEYQQPDRSGTGGRGERSPPRQPTMPTSRPSAESAMKSPRLGSAAGAVGARGLCRRSALSHAQARSAARVRIDHRATRHGIGARHGIAAGSGERRSCRVVEGARRSRTRLARRARGEVQSGCGNCADPAAAGANVRERCARPRAAGGRCECGCGTRHGIRPRARAGLAAPGLGEQHGRSAEHQHAGRFRCRMGARYFRQVPPGN